MTKNKLTGFEYEYIPSDGMSRFTTKITALPDGRALLISDKSLNGWPEYGQYDVDGAVLTEIEKIVRKKRMFRWNPRRLRSRSFGTTEKLSSYHFDFGEGTERVGFGFRTDVFSGRFEKPHQAIQDLIRKYQKEGKLITNEKN